MSRLSLAYSMITAFSEFIAFIQQAFPVVLACASNLQGCSTSTLEELANPYAYDAIADWMGRMTILRALPLVGSLLSRPLPDGL
ncbi:hypothetical protein SCP_1900480 [Sparassis crispa]|uniref:Uncharacterized protein n=1 Tax=Sparassis crispa TaxID=139825 RepID=A0A401H733_9APHY|nr:hypothetical protein SCP_1900480 [Sparassis crispa]GBE90199.1 hypothetical protein SCP_1900480 [Sparassis crispa]